MAIFQLCMHKTHKALANIDSNGHPRTHTTRLNTSKYRQVRAKTKLSHRNRVMRVPKIVKKGESARETTQTGE